MRGIDGKPKTVRDLLQGKRYAIDYYQREYRWQLKHVTELIDDLTQEFLEDYQPSHLRKKVQDYDNYFLGSIIVSERNGQRFVVDGQQRLTTLTLLLILLKHLQVDHESPVNVDPLIASERYGEYDFNMDVEERRDVMQALLDGQADDFDDSGQSESVKNVLNRYRELEGYIADELTGPALPYFVDWLIDNVYFVEITAYTDGDAYTIFETMNDRGLSLTPSDMLKGFLLANITDEDQRIGAGEAWKHHMATLFELASPDEVSKEESDFFKAWLRARFAQTTEKPTRKSKGGDFERLGGEYHRWVREKSVDLGLLDGPAFYRLIAEDLDYYADWYAMLRAAAGDHSATLDAVFWNADLGFTLQYPMLLAPLQRGDTVEDALLKVRLVATYIDIVLARRIWNFRRIGRSRMEDFAYKSILAIRGKSREELCETLLSLINDEESTFSPTGLRVHQQNKYFVHRLLARMTFFLELGAGRSANYTDYIWLSGNKRYEIEHLWANHHDQHDSEFEQKTDFDEYRNRIGGLVLLPKSINSSYGDLPYSKKLRHYLKQNLLAQSLHPDCYQHEPGFLALVNSSGLPFRPHPEFLKVDLDERQELYRLLAERVWSPDRLTELLAG